MKKSILSFKRIALIVLCFYITGCQKAQILMPVEVSPGVIKFRPESVKDVSYVQIANPVRIVLDIEGHHHFKSYGNMFMEKLAKELKESQCFQSIQASPELALFLNISDPWILSEKEGKPGMSQVVYRYKFKFIDMLQKEYLGGTAVAYLSFAYCLIPVSTYLAAVASSPTLFLDRWRGAIGNRMELALYKNTEEFPVFRKIYYSQGRFSLGILCPEEREGEFQLVDAMQKELRQEIFHDLTLFHTRFPN